MEDKIPSFKELSEKIDKVRKAHDNPENIKTERNTSKIFNICIEFIVVTIVGAFLGYNLDQFFNTKPIFLIIGFVMGATAGIVNIIKIAKKLGDQE